MEESRWKKNLRSIEKVLGTRFYVFMVGILMGLLGVAIMLFTGSFFRPYDETSFYAGAISTLTGIILSQEIRIFFDLGEKK